MQTRYQIDADVFAEAESAFSKLKSMLEPVVSNAARVKLRHVERLFRQASRTSQPDNDIERASLESAAATYSYFAERYPAVPPAIMPAMFKRHIDRLSAKLSGTELVDLATSEFEKECRAYKPSPNAGS